MDVRYKSVFIFTCCVLVTVLSTPVPQVSTTNSSSSSSSSGGNITNGKSSLNSTHALSDDFFPVLLTQGEVDLIFFDLPDEYNTSTEINSTAQGNHSTSSQHVFRCNSEPIESEESDYEDSSNSKSSLDEGILPGVNINYHGNKSTTESNKIPLLTSVNSPAGHIHKRHIVQPILESTKQQDPSALSLSKGSHTTKEPIILSEENNSSTIDATTQKPTIHNYLPQLFQSVFPHTHMTQLSQSSHADAE